MKKLCIALLACSLNATTSLGGERPHHLGEDTNSDIRPATSGETKWLCHRFVNMHHFEDSRCRFASIIADRGEITLADSAYRVQPFAIVDGGFDTLSIVKHLPGRPFLFDIVAAYRNDVWYAFAGLCERVPDDQRKRMLIMRYEVDQGHSTVLEYAVQNGLWTSAAYWNDYMLWDEGIPELNNTPAATTLCVAAIKGPVEVFEMLLETASRGTAPLPTALRPTLTLHASKEGRADILALLLSRGMCPNIADEEGSTLLIIAATNAHNEVVRMLLERGAQLNKTNKFGMTALAEAASRGHEGVTRYLLSVGSDVNVLCADRATPLHLASHGGHTETIRALISGGACVNARTRQGKTALFLAAAQGHENAIRLLASAGADVNLPSEDGTTPLLAAGQKRHQGAIATLLQMGAAMPSPNHHRGRNDPTGH